MTTLPKLDKPGAGLPEPERIIAKYVLFPVQCALLNPNKAVRLLLLQARQALTMAESVDSEKRDMPVLIPRLRGLEDSSRYWSVAMTLQHMLITGEAMASMIESLCHTGASNQIVRIEDVKPDSGQNYSSVVSAYTAFLETYPQRIEALGDLERVACRHSHPWFGGLTPYQWLCLNAFHTRIHTSQLRQIILGLNH